MAKKNKTCKSVTKRVKRTATGKLKIRTPGKRHLNADLTPKRRRQLRGTTIITGTVVKKHLIVMNQY